MIILTDYPPRPEDLVILVNFTDAKLGPPLFRGGHRLSSGFTFTKETTVYMEIREVTRSQADALITVCRHCGFASPADVTLVRQHVGSHADQVSSARVRRRILELGW